ncbi:Golgi apyrase [Coemansia javaensis]|uniref:Golgi apyrase n=1 Tax=Coemansia javaensis TaxID=2761396 RepID=A0A9W8HMJ4_9FUNG|nr:Golgi apyrase [Coemansia javaensis]
MAEARRPEAQRQWRRRRRQVGALAAAAVLSLCAVSGFYYAVRQDRPLPGGPAAPPGPRRYGVVVDAGSSGSRAMVYAWDDPREQPGSGLPAIGRAGEQWAYRTDSGISSFAGRAHAVGAEHIGPLLDFAQERIPPDQVPHTPVYLLATAGMRLLAPPVQRQILDAACAYARAHYRFWLPDCAESFRVVAGELEGLYGWVAVNYLLGGFGPGRRTHGFLDMGGASAQIAFEPAPGAADARDLAQVTLRTLDGRDRSFGVFVATFLGHGTNEARRRYVDQIRAAAAAAAATAAAAVDDPCLARGLEEREEAPGGVLRGTGSFAGCVAATEPLLNNTACAVEPCLFAGVHAPEIDFAAQRFVGVSEYWYASHDYLGLGGVWDADRFEARAAQFCQQPWSEARRLADGDSAAVHRVQMQCFKAAWLVNVLHRGFGLPRRLEPPFESVSHVGDLEASWTLGALLLKVAATIAPGDPAAAATTRPGIVLPGRPPRASAIRRLLALWTLLPAAARGGVVLALVFAMCLLAAAAATRPRAFRPLAGPRTSAFPLASLSPRAEEEGRPEQQQQQQQQQQFLGSGLVQSPSAMTPSSPLTSAIPAAPHTPLSAGSAEHRALSAILTEDERPISRTSSVQNLPMLSRRRGPA